MVVGLISIWGSEIIFLGLELGERSSIIHSRYLQAPTFPTYLSTVTIRQFVVYLPICAMYFRERTTEKVDDDASRKKPKKRKHSKEKSEKYKYMKIDDEMPLLSEECREKSKDEGERKKQKKKSKKSKKLKKEKKRKSLSSGHDSPSSEGDKRRKRKNKGHKKSKKRKKSRRHDSEMKGHSSDDSELQLNSKGDGRKVGNYKKMAEKAKELVNISVIGKRKTKSDFEARRPLVQYSDHSSSSDESTDYSRKPMGSSRSTLGDSGDNGKNKTKSSGCEGKTWYKHFLVNQIKNLMVFVKRSTTKYFYYQSKATVL